MKIILYDNSGHPFQIQLSRALAKQGFDVLHLYSSSFQTPKGKLAKQEDDPRSLTIKGVSLPEKFAKYSFLKRRRQELQLGQLISHEIEEYRPNVVIASNVPLDTLKVVQRKCIAMDIAFVFWVQDFYGIAIKKILKSKLSFLGYAIGLYYEQLEKKMLKRSNNIVVISEDFTKELSNMGIDNSNIHIIPNWAPLDELPVESKNNSWSNERGLTDKFCFLYSGTLGLKHNPELLLELAIQFRDNDGVRIVVVSEGLGADWLIQKQKELELDNLIVLNFQPYSMLPKVLGTADVLISILENDAGIYSVPSKVLSYSCAQRALLLAIPLENLAARIVTRYNMGLVVSPDDKPGFVNAAMNFYSQKDLRIDVAKHAREYAQENFEISNITKKFITIINNN